MNRMFFLLLILGFMLAHNAQAQSHDVRRFYRGARAAGMGGASIAVVNDESALLINPAGLGKLRDTYGTLLDPELEVGNNLNPMYKTKAFTNPFDLEAVKATTAATPNTYFHSQLQIFPSFVAKNFGIGVYGRYLMDAQTDATTNTMDTYYLDDLALVMGFNFRFFEGRVKFGVTGKYLSRIEIANSAVDTTQTLDKSTLASEGAAVATDVGLILTGPWTFLPTISAVVHDVGGTNFTSGGLRMTTSTRPTNIEQDIDVAMALFPIHTNRVRSTITAEYQQLKAAALSTDKTRYMHFGLEINYADLLFFRGGLNQRYWTAGIELASEHTQLQFATYGEDVGPVGSPVEDRRLVFKFAFRF